MTVEIILVFSILLITIALFAFEVFPVDKIALFIIVALAVCGLVNPEEAISGFSNTATITVLALMIVAIGMEDTGVISTLARFLKKLHVLPFIILLPVFMFITAGISAFISTTAVVIVFIKIISELSSRFNLPESKLLLPISFAGILGGSCTLMGTSTNLIVNSVALNLGAERFSFFEFSFYGIIFLVVSIVIITIASRWLPKERKETIEDEYKIENYVTSVFVTENSSLIGKKIEDTFLFNNEDISLLKISRNSQTNNAPGRYITLKKGDKLLLLCNLDNLMKLNEFEGLDIHERLSVSETVYKLEDMEEEDNPENLGFAELLILPGSQLIGKSLKEIRRQSIQNATPIAIRKRKNIRNTKERLIRKDIRQIALKPGDRLLVEIPKQDIPRLELLENVAILQEHDIPAEKNNFKKSIAFGILLLIIGLAASGLLTILISSLLGVSLLLLSQCIKLTDVYHRVNWQVIFLLAGMIPLGIAMHNTGADQWLSNQLIDLLSGRSNFIIIGLIFLITMVMSGVISNNATAIIMTPIAISIAAGMELPFKPFILAVLFGANFSFFTPVGYQTNTLIYGMGIYKFRHFLIIGGIVSITLWILGTFMLSSLL
ncbi:SLC13 family permease [Marixanthomonas sp. SCSIO 43207]|uniref:SLC13 family permease n=1 Tax=Marixanthomonas sp. SCSIO 43207 TaxID=2779360 RepID=UPI001CA9F965|nr:SLC13 family permease [Marixanthomonas sp. SCSIO 43207]UAB80541.1 SLC13 family permease [Marixanthomonas sp. SCSIO 43207]